MAPPGVDVLCGEVWRQACRNPELRLFTPPEGQGTPSLPAVEPDSGPLWPQVPGKGHVAPGTLIAAGMLQRHEGQSERTQKLLPGAFA